MHIDNANNEDIKKHNNIPKGSNHIPNGIINNMSPKPIGDSVLPFILNQLLTIK